MRKCLGPRVPLFCALMFLSPVVSGRASADLFFEVLAVTPSRVVDHHVDLQGPFDDAMTEALLTGPQLFSHAVGFGDNAAQDEDAYLNWYKITQPPAEARRIVSVRDPLQGNETYQLTIENATFFLAAAQRITSGPPSKLPDGLNQFKAYKIVGDHQAGQQVKLSGTYGAEHRTASKAIFLCVPVAEAHHDEHFPVKDPQNYMLVYELLPEKHNERVTTLDQFGMNTLETQNSQWLCVPVRVIGKPSTIAK